MNRLCHRILWGTARLFLLLIAYAPWRLLHALASLISRIRAALPGKELEWLNENMRQIFDLPSHSRFARMFRRQVFYHQAISALESIRVAQRPHLARWDGFKEFYEHLKDAGATSDKAPAQAKAKIVITAHLGCWELAGSRAAACCQPGRFYALAKPSRSAVLNRIMSEIRSALGIRLLWTGQKNIQRLMLQALHEGGTLGFVMDQKPVGRIGPSAEFFHHKTEFVSGPAKMSCHSGLGVYGIYCLRQGPMSFRLVCSEIAPPGHRIRDVDLMTRMMAKDMERMIRYYPEQWCWNYRRWRFPASPQKKAPPVRL